tara:strand:- start:364 stop:1191 length:828 start_codon:yes stop_codon:yes gene_type:complete
MSNKMGLHGWVGAENPVLEKYANACQRAAENDLIFYSFKQDTDYRPILEGGPKLFYDTYLQEINEHNNSDVFYSNLDKFRINDSIGEPDLYTHPKIGDFSPTTIKFSHNAIDILEYIKDHGDINNTKNIAEIGGGYGGLCLILSGFIDFDSYTLIDIPEACKLVERYVSEFPQLKGKVKTIPCNELDDNSFDKLDLAIAINSVNECTRETQLGYFSKIFAKTDLGYLIRNPDTPERVEDHHATIDSLGDDFLVNDNQRVEKAYSSQIIVYIKRDS